MDRPEAEEIGFPLRENEESIMYAKYFKRIMDLVLSVTALAVLFPVFMVLTVAGAIAMKGNPFFLQVRPGRKDQSGNEKLFRLIKFRSMSNAKDRQGKLLPDAQRLGKYGAWLRDTSLDELPELLNIALGQMSLCGPRPFLVRDMCFMTEEQKRRHSVRPGLTGLAQVNGRNNITWEKKMEYDLLYIDTGITLLGDIKILLRTMVNVLDRRDTVRRGTVSDMDFGDWLLAKGEIDRAEYEEKMQKAKELIRG